MFGYDDYELYGDVYTIEDVREDLERVVRYFRNMDYWEDAMKAFLVDYRELPFEVANTSDAFAIDENTPIGSLPDWMQQEALGIVRRGHLYYAGRCVFPVKDVRGQVAGFIGWDPFEQPKYLDSKNYGYKAKVATLYGMEKLPEYYVSKEPVIVTEGMMDTLYLRSKGFCALASLGSYLTPYVVAILSRFGNRLVMIPDCDETGDKYVAQVKRSLPKAMCFQVGYGKDVEGCRKIEGHKYEEQLLKELKSVSNPFVRTDLLIRR